LDGEIYLDDTAALVITTANPAVTQGVLREVDRLDTVMEEADADTAAGETIAAVSAVDDTLQDLGDQFRREEFLIRADLLGFPLKLETSSNLPVVPNTGNADDQGSIADCGTPAPSEQSASSEICAKGLVGAQPDGYYNYSRTYEMGTKDQGPNNMGPESLHTVVVYLPSVTQETSPTDQKLVIRNFTEQLDTFTGLATPNTRDKTSYEVTTRIGYRANVEGFHQYRAIPDQPLTVNGSGGVVANVSSGSTTLTLHPDGGYILEDEGETERIHGPRQVLRGFGLPLEDAAFRAHCPDTNAPGYPTDNQSYWPRGDPGSKVFHHYGPNQSCSSNTIEGLQPDHVPAGTGPARRCRPPGAGWQCLPARNG